MASKETAKNLSIPDTFKDSKVHKVITKKDLNKMAWRSMMLQSSFNYERMQAGGWLYSILPGLKKIHKNKDDLSNSMLDNLQFFNAHPFDVQFIQGVILAMEEQKESRSVIRNVKVALMGPLGGIGDALFYLTALPITAGIGASLSEQGNVFGPILFLLLFNIVHFFCQFWLLHYGYNTGTNAIANMREQTKKISRAASIVGLAVVGGLTATFVKFKLNGPNASFAPGGIKISLQSGVFDQIMPALLPLAYTFFCYWLLKKGKNPLWVIVITLVVGLLGSYIGIFA